MVTCAIKEKKISISQQQGMLIHLPGSMASECVAVVLEGKHCMYWMPHFLLLFLNFCIWADIVCYGISPVAWLGQLTWLCPFLRSCPLSALLANKQCWYCTSTAHLETVVFIKTFLAINTQDCEGSCIPMLVTTPIWIKNLKSYLNGTGSNSKFYNY